MNKHAFSALCIGLTVVASACVRGKEPTDVTAAGAEKTPKTRILEAGAAVLQDTTPVNRLQMYVCGFHFANGDMGHQMEAHHYCMQVNEDLIQCALYDGNGKDAKLVGIEYIISAKLFDTLPAEEKKLWHSHVYEVKSGTLVAPGLPEAAEHELMEKLVGTYGKTWHTWNTMAGDTLPMGIPTLMMGFTGDGQVKPELVQMRDSRMKVSTEKNRESRADIESPPVLPGADAWQKGEAVQLEVKPVEMR
jgi:hypothetical protein